MPETDPYGHVDKMQHLNEVAQMIASLESNPNKHPQDVKTLQMLHEEHDKLQAELGETIH